MKVHVIGAGPAKTLLHNRIFHCCEACDFMTWDEPQAITCNACGATMFVHRFKGGASMLYCGNENCSTRANHPVNKILDGIKQRAAARKQRKAKKSEEKA